MRKSFYKRKILAAGILFFALSPTTYAACDYDTNIRLNAAANGVEAKYEIVEKITDYNGVEHPEISDEVANTFESGYVHMDFINIHILNVTDDIYFTITGKEDGLNDTFTKSDLPADGIYTYKLPDIYSIRHYTIKIYSNSNGCRDTELRTIELTTPKYNEYSTSAYCENEKFKDNYNCQKFVTTDVSLSDEQLSANKITQSSNNAANSFWTKYGSILISVVIIIVILCVGIVIYNKNHHQKEEN